MRSPLLLLLLLSLLLALSIADDTTLEYDDSSDLPYEDDEEYGDADSHSLLDFPVWRDFSARVQRHVDGEGLIRARRWGNIVNGVLLGVTGPVALAISTFGMKLSNVVLSLYVTGFGGLLTSLELGLAPVAPWVAKNLSYLTTGNGRTALLVFAGNLVWAFGPTGLVPALLTCANALFNANFNKILSFVQADDDVVSMDGSTLDASLPSVVEQEYESAASQHVEEDPIDLGDLGEQLDQAREEARMNDEPVMHQQGHDDEATEPRKSYSEPTPTSRSATVEVEATEDEATEDEATEDEATEDEAIEDEATAAESTKNNKATKDEATKYEAIKDEMAQLDASSELS